MHPLSHSNIELRLCTWSYYEPTSTEDICQTVMDVAMPGLLAISVLYLIKGTCLSARNRTIKPLKAPFFKAALFVYLYVILWLWKDQLCHCIPEFKTEKNSLPIFSATFRDLSKSYPKHFI